MRIRFCCLAAPVRNRQERGAASLVGFAGAASGGDRTDYPARLTPYPRPQAAEVRRAGLIRQREPTESWQLSLVQAITGT